MKKLLALGALLLGFQAAQAGIFGDSPKKYENIMCFIYAIGDDVKFPKDKGNPKCADKTISDMNKEGWRVAQVVTGLSVYIGIGVLFEREMD